VQGIFKRVEKVQGTPGKKKFRVFPEFWKATLFLRCEQNIQIGVVSLMGND